MFKSENEQLRKRVEAVETVKPEQIRWIVEQQATKLAALDAEQRNARYTVFEMKTKIDVIAAWVQDQKGKHP